MSLTGNELMASLTDASAKLPNRTLFGLALAGLRTRLMRSLVTLTIVVLAIAYLSYSQISNELVLRMAQANNEEINNILRRAKINVEETRQGSAVDKWLVRMALLTCAVGIMNAMVMSVTERFREIGTMKCLGAENPVVVKLFLIESALLGVVGSIVGILFGALIAFVVGFAQFGSYAREYMPPFSAFASIAGLSFLAGVLLCLAGAGYPARIAARMRPVEALRVEE